MEWLFFAYNAKVKQEFVPESAINQVTCCVFCAANIEVNIAPIVICQFANQCLCVVWVHIAEVVSRRTCKTWHSVQFQFISLFSFPFRSTSKRWFACFCWEIFVNFWQLEWQFAFVQHVRHTIFVIYREWLAPIALTAEYCITEAVVHFHLTESLFRDILFHLRDSLFHLQSIQESRVANHALFCIIALFAHICTFDKWYDRQIEVACKSIVATIVCWHCHNCTCTITSQYVVRNPYWYFVASQWVYCV